MRHRSANGVFPPMKYMFTDNLASSWSVSPDGSAMTHRPTNGGGEAAGHEGSHSDTVWVCESSGGVVHRGANAGADVQENRVRQEPAFSMAL